MTDFTRVKPYGDIPGDGKVQVSFTLPVPCGEEARQAALILAATMELNDPEVVFMQALDQDFTYFIVYGSCRHPVDYTAIHVVKPDYRLMEPAEINRYIQENFGRPLNIVGACIESDAHTVGIDAIMNMKGYNMHKGLESYPQINAYNLGAQVSCEELLAKTRELQADALLVSQVVTQRNVHVQNLTRLADMLEAEEMRENLVLVVGGPRITAELAKELGYDAGFGPGTYAEAVASFVVQALTKRKGEL